MSYSYPEDIAALAAEHGPFLRSLARALVKDAGAADDLAQETWAAALASPVRSMERPRAWLSTILHRKAVSRIRRESVRAARPLEPSDMHVSSPDPGPLDTAAMLEREQLLLRAMEALREPYRTAIYLRYREGIGATDIAERTATPVKTVRTRLHRGLSELREELDSLTRDRRTWLASLTPLAFPGGMPVGALAATSAGAASGATILSMKTFFPALVALVLACIGAWWLLPGDDGPNPLIDPSESGAPVEALTATVDLPPSEELAGPAAPGERRSTAPAAAAETSLDGSTTASMAQTESVTLAVKHADGAPAAARSIILGSWQNKGRPFVPRVRTTDSSGVIRFEGLNAAGAYYAKDALGGGSRPFNLATGTERHFELILKKDVEVLGVVVDALGEPAPGAGIWSAPWSGNDQVSVRHGTSGADGSFAARMPVDGTMQAVLAGLVPSPMLSVSDLEEFEPGRFRGTLRLREEGASLTGIVVDADGQPIQGAVVVAGPKGGYSMGDIQGASPIPLHVWTGEDGRFRYPAGLPEGTWPLVCYAEGFATHRSEIGVTAAPLPAQRIELGTGVTVSGRIYSSNGTPAVGARIEYVTAGSTYSRRTYGHEHQTSSGDDGLFELQNVPLGPAILRAASPRGLPLERVLQPIDVAVAEDQVVRIDLSDAPFIAGHVIDQDGQPMAGFEVRASGKSMNQNHVWGVITDVQGAFRLTSLEPGADGGNRWDLAVRPRNEFIGNALGTALGVAAGDDSVLIQAVRPVPRTAFIEGRFQGENGFVPTNLDAAIWRLGVNVGLFLDVDAGTGAFRYGPVAPGTFTISGTVGDNMIFQKSGIVVAAGETVDVGILRAGAGGHARVSLDLALPPDAPLDEIESLSRNMSVAMFTDVGGEAWLDRDGDQWVNDTPIEPGTWRVELRSSKIVIARSQLVEIRDGETAEVTLQGTLARSLRVKLELPAEATWSTLTLKAHWPDGTLATESDPIRRAELSRPDRAMVNIKVPLGSVRFLVESDTDLSHDETVEIPDFPARFRRLTLTLE